MPKQISAFDPAGKRIIHSSRRGVGEETVIAYEVINGEYRETKRLNLISWNTPYILYHYELGKLVEEITINDKDYLEELIELFPNMDYWSKG